MTYTPPTVEVVGTVEELTLKLIPKGTTNTPDGFRLHHQILTSI